MRARLILYLVALVVLPTAVLSILAAHAVRTREMDLDRRMEVSAIRTLKAAADAALAGMREVHRRLAEETAAALSSSSSSVELLKLAERIRRSNVFVGGMYVARPGGGFEYPPADVGAVAGVTNEFDLLDRAVSLRLKDAGYEAAVREYERILASPGIPPAVQAEAALGAGRCYRLMGQFKFAAGAFRQVAGYSGGLRDSDRLPGDGEQTTRDSAGFLHSLTALRELAEAYREAAEGDILSARERWRRLYVESRAELFERTVLFFDRIVPAQRAVLLNFLGVGAPLGEAVPDVIGMEEQDRRTARLTLLLRERERAAEFGPKERAGLAAALAAEKARSGAAPEFGWTAVEGRTYSLGTITGSTDSIVGFSVEPSGLERHLRGLVGESVSDMGLVADVVVGGEPGAGRSGDTSGRKKAIASQGLPWPFENVFLKAYLADPAALRGGDGMRIRLQEWGILVLALGVLAGAWAVLSAASGEMRRLRERSDYAAGISHDLRTPLASMRMLAESLYLNRVGDAERQRQFLKTIVGEAGRMGHLVERVLYFVRFGENALRYQMRQTDIGKTVEEAVESYLGGSAGRASGIAPAVTVNVEPGLPRVMADPGAISQVVLNLVDNAAKYSKAAGAGGAGPIRISVEGAGGREVRISVADEGIGIEKSELPKIFHRFYRSAGARKGPAPGIGLGLAMCRHITRGHGGRITVSSEPGKGSTFTVALPVKEG